MSSMFWDEVRDLFHAAAGAGPDTRERLLISVSPRVREEVESLLAAHEESGDFLEQSVWDLIDANDAERLVGASIGPYRVVRQLGHGGMGTVFLAVREHEEFSQRVALQLARGGEALVQRFRQERQILAALEHPNIARLIDGGTTADGLPYLVMEYVEGTPIDEYAKSLSTQEKLRLFLQLCDAVEHAHRALVIHRDIKPQNVLVTANGTAKLLDFGIAKLASASPLPETTSTRVMTPQYASPEQMQGGAITTATDVFSLGVLLFELLTAKRPFNEARLPNTEAPRVLRGDLTNILACALEVDPARRYGSVERFAEDIRRHLSGHPVNARRATFAYRAAKFLRRNTLAVATAAAIVAVTAIAFAATLHQKRIAERRFDEVRSLARAVVFELHDAIAPLPGSTAARELLVRRALVYLDRLAAEGEGNAPLRMELAGAYLKIGDVQGLPYRANLGDTAGATESYRKALAISQSVSADEPKNAEALALLADAHDRLGLVEQRAQRWDVAIAQHEAARAIRESLPREPFRNLALARTWVAIGDCRYIGKKRIPDSLMRGTARQAYESALVALEDLPERGPHRRDALVEIGRANQRLGGYFTGIVERDLERAVRHHDAALQALAERAQLDAGDAVARRNFADQFVMKATAQNMARDGAGALESTDRALPMLRELAAADPRNAEAQRDIAFALSERGRALALLGRNPEAELAFGDAIKIREQLVTGDPTNQEDRIELQRVVGQQDQLRRARP
jgi:tetratricopeptide (TPR) repeat protein/predicted Ser/Thr protein kinase